MQSLTKTLYRIAQISKFCKSPFAHHLQLLQKSLLAHGLERSRKKFLFFSQKVLVDLTEYPLMQGCLVCSITHISSKVLFWEKKSRISSTCILCIVSAWMNRKNRTKSQYLSQYKRSCSDLYSYWLKKNSLNKYFVSI